MINLLTSIPIYNRKIMKIKLLIFAVSVFVLSACTQYTCPTYAKKDAKKDAAIEKLEEGRI